MVLPLSTTAIRRQGWLSWFLSVTSSNLQHPLLVRRHRSRWCFVPLTSEKAAEQVILVGHMFLVHRVSQILPPMTVPTKLEIGSLLMWQGQYTKFSSTSFLEIGSLLTWQGQYTKFFSTSFLKFNQPTWEMIPLNTQHPHLSLASSNTTANAFSFCTWIGLFSGICAQWSDSLTNGYSITICLYIIIDLHYLCVMWMYVYLHVMDTPMTDALNNTNW